MHPQVPSTALADCPAGHRFSLCLLFQPLERGGSSWGVRVLHMQSYTHVDIHVHTGTWKYRHTCAYTHPDMNTLTCAHTRVYTQANTEMGLVTCRVPLTQQPTGTPSTSKRGGGLFRMHTWEAGLGLGPGPFCQQQEIPDVGASPYQTGVPDLTWPDPENNTAAGRLVLPLGGGRAHLSRIHLAHPLPPLHRHA